MGLPASTSPLKKGLSVLPPPLPPPFFKKERQVVKEKLSFIAKKVLSKKLC